MDDDVKPDIEAMNVDAEPNPESMSVDVKPVPESMSVDVKPDPGSLNADVKPDLESMHPSTIRSLDDLGPYIQRQNNAKNFVHFSDIPKICFEEPCMLGVDEAGRGPVLGPMVYGIAFCPLGAAETLKKLGCADSKQLTEEKRDTIFNDMNTKDYAKDNIGWAVEVISPNTISTSMLRRAKHSLNEVSMDSAIALIHKAVELGVNIAEVYVDTVGPPEKYEAKLSKIFPDFKITVAKKADSTYPIVSAASICAKVSRDHALKVWQFPEGAEVTDPNTGSGYPGDPVTKKFLRANIDPIFGFPRIVRFSWSTAENVLTTSALDVQFEDEEENAKANKNNASIKNFFGGGKNESHVRHMFFRDRHLHTVVDF